MRSQATKFAVATALCLSVGMAFSADPEAGRIAQGGSPLLAVPGVSGGQIVCTLPENTQVLVVAEKPLIGPDALEAIPGYYKKVLVVDGLCAGKAGWVVLEKFERGSHESRMD